MLLCKSCDEWYHHDCVDVEINEDKENDMTDWECCHCDAYVAFINKLEKDKNSSNADRPASNPPVLEVFDDE